MFEAPLTKTVARAREAIPMTIKPNTHARGRRRAAVVAIVLEACSSRLPLLRPSSALRATTRSAGHRWPTGCSAGRATTVSTGWRATTACRARARPLLLRAGRDTAVAEVGEAVAKDCEIVKRIGAAPVAPPPPPATPPPPPPPPPAPPPPAAPRAKPGFFGGFASTGGSVNLTVAPTGGALEVRVHVPGGLHAAESVERRRDVQRLRRDSSGRDVLGGRYDRRVWR